jgi:hypothetical protein
MTNSQLTKEQIQQINAIVKAVAATNPVPTPAAIAQVTAQIKSQFPNLIA